MSQNVHILVFGICANLLFFPLAAQTFTDIGAIQGIEALNMSLDGYGSGLSSFDFNQDGWDDLSLVMESDTQKLYINNQGTYELAPFSFYSQGENKQLLWVDYDNDYDLDIFLTTNNGSIKLLKNDGNFQFSDVTIVSGLSTSVAKNYGASFADYDLDGDLDLYVCKYLDAGDSSNLAHQNNLYKNNGDGTFTDVTFVSGFDNEIATSFQSLWLDYNYDGYPDLYIINDRAPFENKFYQNNGDGTFTNVTALTATAMPGACPMSISLGDYDNDGDQDIFVSEAGNNIAPGGRLFTQSPTFVYANQASNVGIGISSNMWGSTWLDYNNDGFLDLFVATSGAQERTNYFYKNDSTISFLRDTTIFSGDYKSKSYGVARADVNRDGYADIAVVNLDTLNNFLWLNSGGTNNYIRVTLEGTISNSMAIGSWIKVFAGGKNYSQYTLCGENYLGQNSQHHIFGLGQDTIVDSVHVEFLSGIIDKYSNLPVNQTYHFVEGGGAQVFNINLQGTNPFCEGDSVILSAPFMQSYDWNTGDSTQSIIVYTEGTYSLNAIDTNGLNTLSNSIQLNQVALPNVQYFTSDVSCYNYLDGQVQLLVDNEGQDYDVDWSNGAQGDSIYGLGEGFYHLLYVDEYGCEYRDSVLVASPLPLNIQANIIPCTDSSLGSIDVLVNGGLQPYIIMIDSVTVGNTIAGLDSGVYVLSVLDANDCVYEEFVQVPFLSDTSLNTALNDYTIREISIHPNPAQDYIRISSLEPFQEGLAWKIINLSGETILDNYIKFLPQNKQADFTIQLPENMARGVYLLKIVYQNTSLHFKLIKA